MSRPLYGRRRELRALEQAWTSGKPELLIAAGRRRSGKSYLLTHVLAERRGFYYQATKGTSREQLARVSGAVGVQFPDSRVDLAGGFRDWESFFEFIVVEAAGQPFLLILDEVPYLLDAIRGFGSVLQAVWDHRLADSQIKLVLSGSYISAMHRLTAADQPLHGRRTVSLPFLPFSYRDAASFMAQYPPRDQLIGYAAFGGLPGQLSLIDPTLSIVKNIETHLIDPVGRLSDEGERLLDAFRREAGVHYAIVRAVASCEHKWSRITSRVGKDSASLSRPLGWLLDMDILERVIPATDTRRGDPHVCARCRCLGSMAHSPPSRSVRPRRAGSSPRTGTYSRYDPLNWRMLLTGKSPHATRPDLIAPRRTRWSARRSRRRCRSHVQNR